MSNKENQSTKSIQSLFKSLKDNLQNIEIPPYQRAYSWEEKHYTQFFEDLLNAKGKRYYLGHFYFEKEKDGNTLFIIDGQQRLTTTILFFSAIAKIKVSQKQDIEDIKNTYLTDIFRTIEEDHLIFKNITQDHRELDENDHTYFFSQRRLIKAFKFFKKELEKLDNETIDSIQKTLENSIISTSTILDKIEATQIFEYQNNRGKEPSNFEIIKAYLMSQIYIQNTNNEQQANKDIKDIENSISETYRHIEDVDEYFSENELLNNYCDLFFNIDGNIEAIKKVLNKEHKKIDWIKDFFENFAILTRYAKSIVNNKNQEKIKNLFLVGNKPNWKIVLLALFYRGDNQGDIYDKILKLLEILCFKLKLGDFRTDRLPNYTKRYFDSDDSYNIDNLHDEIKDATENGFQPYWNEEDKFKNIIVNHYKDDKYHYERNIINYVLWQYENEFRIKYGSGTLSDDKYKDYTIEHINPQTPKGEKNSKEFEKNFLHLAGNLNLLTSTQNSKFGNKPFENKRELYQDTALSSYTEIRQETQWTEKQILKRHNNISNFVKKYFDTTNL